ncbi:MAG: hypothetical protein HGA19_04310, partial [Oscillochloris sp.]|nr:hypothetical protein [Oscillochloris sp.]
NILPFALLVKQWLSPILGHSIANATATFIKSHELYQYPAISLIVLLPYVLFGLGLAFWGRNEARILCLASIVIASISFLNSVDSQTMHRLLINHLSAVGSGRYYYAPNTLFALSMLIPLKSNSLSHINTQMFRFFRFSCIVMTSLMLLVGATDFILSNERHPANFSGPDWRNEVLRWQTGQSEELHIWPVPWAITVPKDTPIDLEINNE